MDEEKENKPNEKIVYWNDEIKSYLPTKELSNKYCNLSWEEINDIGKLKQMGVFK